MARLYQSTRRTAQSSLARGGVALAPLTDSPGLVGGTQTDGSRAARPRFTDSPFQSFFAADASTQTTPLLPSWSAITVSEGASLSSTTVPPAATAAAIRCSATSGVT